MVQLTYCLDSAAFSVTRLGHLGDFSNSSAILLVSFGKTWASFYFNNPITVRDILETTKWTDSWVSTSKIWQFYNYELLLNLVSQSFWTNFLLLDSLVDDEHYLWNKFYELAILLRKLNSLDSNFNWLNYNLHCLVLP